MNRYEAAAQYHKRGFNCCQSVLAAVSDLTGMTEQESFNISSGFGGGAGTGELCGAITGALMALSAMNPTDVFDPVGSKARVVKLSKEFQKRFMERFSAVRCQDLKKLKYIREGATAAADAMGETNHCTVMIITAVEILEEMLSETESKLPS